MAIKGKTFITVKRNDQQLRLDCRVYGSPLPSIHWQKDRMSLPSIGDSIAYEDPHECNSTLRCEMLEVYNSSLSYSISNEVMSKCSLKSTLTLTINNVVDLGLYHCIASNTHGKSYAFYRINGK